MLEKEKIPYGKRYLPQKHIRALLESEKNLERAVKDAARIRFNEREREVEK